MVTRAIPDAPRTEFSLRAGYFDDPHWPKWKWTSDWLTFNGIDFSHSRGMGDASVLVSAGWRTNDGYKRNSDFERYNTLTKVTYALSDRRSLTGLLIWALEDHGHSTEWKSQGEALDIDESFWEDRTRSAKLAGYLKFRNLDGVRNLVTGTLNWYFTDWDNDFHDARDEARALRLGGSLQTDIVSETGIEATFGVEGWHTGVASTMFGDRDIGQIGFFGEAKAGLSQQISLSAGARYDGHYLGEGREWQDLVSPRVAVVIKPAPSTAINMSAGRGFRAPTVAEMFTSTTSGGFTVKPNPDLSPESGTTYEIAFASNPDPMVDMALGFFISDYSDLIEPDFDPSDGKIQFTNVRDARVRGLEARLSLILIKDLARFTASYMYLSAEDRSTGEPLAYRSRHNVTSALDVTKGPYGAGVDFRYRSRIESVKVYEHDERVPIYVTDLRGEINLDRLRLSAKVSNLFQYNYTEIERTLAPIRNYTLTLSGRY
jgi:outer membrane receptor protein involved in Fe transport